jgi:hypothetical protein
VLIVVFSNLYQEYYRDNGTTTFYYPAFWNFIYIIVVFLSMQLIGVKVSPKVNLLVQYGIMVINIPFQVLLVTEGHFLAKWIYLSLGALAIYYLYIPFMGRLTQIKSDGNK